MVGSESDGIGDDESGVMVVWSAMQFLPQPWLVVEMAAPGQVAMMAVRPAMVPENSMRWACALHGPISNGDPTGVLATRREACSIALSGGECGIIVDVAASGQGEQGDRAKESVAETKHDELSFM